MKAAWYERQGPAREVLVVGDPLAEIARAHELVEHPQHGGRIVVVL